MGKKEKDKVRFIYSLPRGYNKGWLYRDHFPCVSSSAWGDNNLMIWIEPKKSGSN